MNFRLCRFVLFALLLFLSCVSFSAFSQKAFLFGNFTIDDQRDESDRGQGHYYFAFRNDLSEQDFIYDPDKLVLFECSEVSGSGKVIGVQPGRYRIYAIIKLEDDGETFLTYNRGVVEGTGLKSIDTVDVKAGSALYLGSYHIVITKHDNIIEISWMIEDQSVRDVAWLKSIDKNYAKMGVQSLLDGGRHEIPR